MTRVLLVLTLLGSTFFALDIYARWDRPPAPVASAERSATEVEIEQVHLTQQGYERQAFSAIASSPLFAPTRRPPVVEVAAPSAVPVETMEATLTGIFQAGGRSAVMIRVDGQEDVRLRVGDLLAGWRIAAIEGDGIALKRQGEAATLTVGETLALSSDPAERLGAAPPGAEDAARVSTRTRPAAAARARAASRARGSGAPRPSARARSAARVSAPARRTPSASSDPDEFEE